MPLVFAVKSAKTRRIRRAAAEFACIGRQSRTRKKVQTGGKNARTESKAGVTFTKA